MSSIYPTWLIVDEDGTEYGTQVAAREGTAVYMMVQDSAAAFTAQVKGRTLTGRRID